MRSRSRSIAGPRRRPVREPAERGFVAEAISRGRLRRFDGDPRSRTVDDRFRRRANRRARGRDEPRGSSWERDLNCANPPSETVGTNARNPNYT